MEGLKLLINQIQKTIQLPFIKGRTKWLVQITNNKNREDLQLVEMDSEQKTDLHFFSTKRILTCMCEEIVFP